jgi:hypothetical protein
LINKRNVFFGVVLLLIVFIVAVNFDKFIGESVRRVGKATEITAFPKEILPGEKIYVEIIPGGNCAELEVGIYKKDKSYTLARWKEIMGHSRYCKPINVSYKTWGSWDEGEYIVKVKDIGTGKFVEDNFFIVG